MFFNQECNQATAFQDAFEAGREARTTRRAVRIFLYAPCRVLQRWVATPCSRHRDHRRYLPWMVACGGPNRGTV